MDGFVPRTARISAAWEKNITNADAKRPAIAATAGWGYLRLRREGYTKARLRAWTKAICAQSWTEAYVFMKHEDKGMAPKLARDLMDLTAKGG